MDVAGDVIPGMHKKLILHAGPPISWERMCGPMKGAVIGAVIYEGLAKTEEEAVGLIESGEIQFDPNHEHQAIGPMAGIISASMPVFVLKNMTYGNVAYTNVNEGPGKALRFGAYNENVITRLNWMREKMYPVLKQAIELSGGIDIKAIVAQAIQMGDDNHNRHKASTSLFMRELAKYLIMVDAPKEDVYQTAEHLEKIDMFNVNLVMGMCKTMSDAASSVKGATIVTVMARNGVDFGIKVAGTGKPVVLQHQQIFQLVSTSQVTVKQMRQQISGTAPSQKHSEWVDLLWLQLLPWCSSSEEPIRTVWRSPMKCMKSP